MNGTAEGAGGPPITLRAIDLGRVAPLTAQAFCESIAVSVARNASPATVLFARPQRPYVSLGFHQSYDEELDPRYLARHRLPVVRRVTGGGTTYLDPSQAFYEVIGPCDGGPAPGPGSFARWLAAPLAALHSFGLPARLRAPSDLEVRGRKISGNAGGEYEGVPIVQGGLLGRANVEAMAGVLRSPGPGFRALARREMRRALTSLAKERADPPSTAEVVRELGIAFAALPGVRLRWSRPTGEEIRRFRREVVPRHRDPAWWRLPPVPRPATRRVRAIRVAGARWLEAWSGADGGGLLYLVFDGDRPEAAYRPAPGRSAGREGVVPLDRTDAAVRSVIRARRRGPPAGRAR